MKLYLSCLFTATFLFNCGAADSLSNLLDDVQQDIYQIYLTGVAPVHEISNIPVTADKIIYFLFNSSSPQTYTIIDSTNASILSTSKTIVFLIHGWIENQQTEWYELLKNAFFVRDSEYLIIEVDWSFYANLNYVSAQYDAKSVGFLIGEFIVTLNTDFSIPLNNILIVGHSLGGQVAGFVGKKVFELLNTKLPRIIGLDPAGPLYEGITPTTDRIAPTDADVVHIIHTNGGQFGYSGKCGTIDFYPNGGMLQPGCLHEVITNITQIDSKIFCDHHRSWRYFIEGIQATPKFVSKKCNNYVAFLLSSCSAETEEMCSLNTTKTDTFFLTTNNASPYSK